LPREVPEEKDENDPRVDGAEKRYEDSLKQAIAATNAIEDLGEHEGGEEMSICRTKRRETPVDSIVRSAWLRNISTNNQRGINLCFISLNRGERKEERERAMGINKITSTCGLLLGNAS
jgi:hypothetical protein